MGVPSLLQPTTDFFDYSVCLLEHFVVPEPKDDKPFSF